MIFRVSCIRVLRARRLILRASSPRPREAAQNGMPSSRSPARRRCGTCVSVQPPSGAGSKTQTTSKRSSGQSLRAPPARRERGDEGRDALVLPGDEDDAVAARSDVRSRPPRPCGSGGRSRGRGARRAADRLLRAARGAGAFLGARREDRASASRAPDGRSGRRAGAKRRASAPARCQPRGVSNSGSAPAARAQAEGLAIDGLLGVADDHDLRGRHWALSPCQAARTRSTPAARRRSAASPKGLPKSMTPARGGAGREGSPPGGRGGWRGRGCGGRAGSRP